MSDTILIVDDEPSVRALLRDVLELEDYEVEEAPDGTSAVAAFESQTFDLVILDIMMPGISGLDVLRKMRASSPDSPGSDPETPIILLTAASDDETTWAGWTSGASVFLSKPFDPSNLLEWVERTLAGEKGNDPTAGAAARTEPAPDANDLAAEFRGLQG